MDTDIVYSTPRWEQRFDSYKKALARLTAIVNEYKKRPLNEFEKDSMVQRFEFTHELAWKVMKSYAEYQGESEISGSRDATRWACNNHLINNGQTWMNMIRSRNETVHNYDEQVADSVITMIVAEYHAELLALYEMMQKKVSTTPKDLFSQE